MYIVALNGSPKRDGNTMNLIEILRKNVESKDIKFEIIHAYECVLDCKQPFCLDCISPCDQNCLKGTKLEKAYESITKADILIMASPVYFGNVTAGLKAFWDKSRYIRSQKSWVGKLATVMAVGGSSYGGQETVLHSMQNMLQVQGFTLFNDSNEESDAGHFGICANRPSINDETAKKRIEIMAKTIKKVI